MDTGPERLRARLRELRADLESELEESRAEFRDRIERGKVMFEAEARAGHLAAKERLSGFLARTRPRWC